MAAKKRRRMVLECMKCGERQSVTLIGDEQLDDDPECENCGQKEGYIVLEDDGQQFKHAKCLYCNHIVPANKDFDAEEPCSKCGRSGAYIMLEE
jgi:ribosomal protein S14